jgi:mercuric reductase
MRVEGMTCSSCEDHVDQALRETGARQVEADFRRGEALLTVDAPPDVAALSAAVRHAGYTPGAIELHEAAKPEVATPYRPGAAEPVAPGPAPTRRNGPTGTRDRYDLAIVGSGGGAFAAAIAATERGAKVVMIERGTLGGTCVNVGCVPSKTQLRAGELFWRAGHQPFHGISTRAAAVDLSALVNEKDQLVSSLRREKYEDLIGEYGWELVRGEARFIDHRTLRVDDRAIQADGLVLATGARPSLPPVPGLDQVEYLTSTSLLDFTTLPKHLIVIGAGYVGLELGQLFRQLGSQVTLAQRGTRLLRSYDPEIAETVDGILHRQGIQVITGATFVRAEQSGIAKRLVVRVGETERVLEGDALLVATGRTPNTEALDLSVAGVEVGSRGEVVVDDRLRTSNPRVFAAGDVTLGPQYVYVAAYEGALAAENALGGERLLALRAVPGVIFTTPSIATVGLTEEAARDTGHQVKAATLPLHYVPRAVVNRDEDGLFKIVADARTDQVLGVHVVAENAGDVIYAGVLAVRFHLTVRDLTDTFAPYLTMSEGLKLAAQSFSRDPARLSCCAA